MQRNYNTCNRIYNLLEIFTLGSMIITLLRELFLTGIRNKIIISFGLLFIFTICKYRFSDWIGSFSRKEQNQYIRSNDSIDLIV